MPKEILSGGKEIEIYDNRTCRICGIPMKHEICCRRVKGNICYKHCKDCEHFIAIYQHCLYREIPEEIKKLLQRKNA